MNKPAILAPDEYLTEADVLARFPRLSRAELRRARKANPPQIAFYAFPSRSGGPCCTAAQVQEYIERTYLRVPQCQSDAANPSHSDSRSGTITSTSPIPIAAESSTHAAMTTELAQHAAEALAQQISKPPRSSSRRSSPRPRKTRGKGHLKVVASSP